MLTFSTFQAKEHHPDSKTTGSDGEAVKFIELTEAYKRLTYESRATAQGLHNVDRTGEGGGRLFDCFTVKAHKKSWKTQK